ncbi:MAG: hypothetical protein QXX81_07480 [Zestosphaera sp.]
MRTAILLYLATLLILAVILPQPIQASNPELVDCSCLLILLEKALDAASYGTPGADRVLHALREASIPGELGRLHKEVYSLLLEYYDYAVAATQDVLTREEIQRVVAELTVLQSKLPGRIGQYVGMLSSCAHDPAIPTMLRVSISSSVDRIAEEIIPHLIDAALSKRMGSSDTIHLELSKEACIPGEVVELKVVLGNPALRLESVYILTWPSLSRVSTINVTPSPWGYSGLFRIPKASEFVGSTTRSGLSLVAVAVARNVSDGGILTSYRLFKVAYKVPNISVEAPATIRRGDTMVLRIHSDSNYSSLIRFNGMTVGNITLIPGVTLYYLDTLALNVSAGVNLIEIVVEPTSESVGLTVSKTVLAVSKTPEVEIGFSEPFFTNDGFLTLVLINKNPADAHLVVKVYVGGRFAGEYILNDSLTVRAFASPLPSLITDLSVIVEPSTPGQDPYIFRDSVLVINPVATLLLGLISVPAVVLTAGSEKGITLMLRSLVRGGDRSSRRSMGGPHASLTKPYMISSRIADLYYATIRRLKVSTPEASETLREHFSRTFSGITGIRELLWRFLVLVELDLYSRRRQNYVEALKLAEEVMRNED